MPRSRTSTRPRASRNPVHSHPVVGMPLDCGCSVRSFVPIDPPECGFCGLTPEWPKEGVRLLTSSHPGTVSALYWACLCSPNFEIRVPAYVR